MLEFLQISSKTNAIVYYLNDNLNTNYIDIQDCIKKLILEKYNNNDNNNDNYDNFDEFIIAKQNAPNQNQLQNQINISDENIQNLLLSIFSDYASFENFIQTLILLLNNSRLNNNKFSNFNDFWVYVQNKYCTLDGLINFYKDKDISQIESDEKQKIISRFENLPQSEKNKFDLYKLSSLKNRYLELLLINQININIEIKDKNDEFKSYLQYLFTNMSYDEILNSLANIKEPFFRLYVALQYGINLYDDSGKLDPNKVNKIISEQDYEYYQTLFNQLNISRQNYSQHLEICHKYALFLSFYKCLPNKNLNEFDQFITEKYIEQPTLPLEIAGYIIGIVLLFALSIFVGTIGLLTANMLFFLLTAASIAGVVKLITVLDENLDKNKKIKREQNQFKPEKNIPQETQANQKNTNSIEESLLTNISQNEISSNNKIPHSVPLDKDHVPQ